MLICPTSISLASFKAESVAPCQVVLPQLPCPNRPRDPVESPGVDWRFGSFRGHGNLPSDRTLGQVHPRASRHFLALLRCRQGIGLGVLAERATGLGKFPFIGRQLAGRGGFWLQGCTR
ncbi:unnamed protein product [Symbiodinium microadriaticum]|nr:unnamed protein product [Symbiodinium microadriaticum]CAE7917827.1 unnamed protein product [Symbiodinium sp. KB8]